MLEKPVTRKEIYLATASGDYSGDIPEAITREEKYLKKIAENGSGGGSTPDLTNYYTKSETDTKLNTKVEKISGKQLSTQDYTTAEKTKLAGIAEGATAVGTKYQNGAERFNNATIPTGQWSHAEGNATKAGGFASHAEGYSTDAGANNSHAEGNLTKAYGDASHAEGYNTTASKECSHAEGYECVASGMRSHAEGSKTIAEGNFSHAEGSVSKATGNISHAEGLSTIAAFLAQHVQGKYNIVDSSGKYAFILGNGTDDENRSNAIAIDWDGLIYVGNSTTGVNVLDLLGRIEALEAKI